MTEQHPDGVQPTRAPGLTDEQIDAIVLRHPFVNVNREGRFTAVDKSALRACIREAISAGNAGVPVPHLFKEWSGGGPVRPYCANCGRLRNDPLHAVGVRSPDGSQPK